jgi:hypothetical protein
MEAATSAPRVLQQPDEPGFALWNEGPGDVQVQVNALARDGKMGRLIRGPQMLPAQWEAWGELVSLPGPCNQSLWVQVHGRDYVVRGNFCSETHPDEIKTLVIFGSSSERPVVAYEDVE